MLKLTLHNLSRFLNAHSMPVTPLYSFWLAYRHVIHLPLFSAH